MQRLALVALLSLLALPLIISSTFASSASFTQIDVPFPNVRATVVSGINDLGEIVGEFGDNNGFHGFVYDRGHFQQLDVPFPGVTETNPQAINNHGEIVGIYRDDADKVHGFLYDRSGFSRLDIPLAFETDPTAINDLGQIVGAYCASIPCHAEGFLYDNGQFITLDVPFSGVKATRAFGINNRGQIVGNYDDGTGTHDFLYDDNQFRRLGTFPFSDVARAINDRGEIVGIFFDANDHNFFYDKGHFALLPLPESAEALGLNNRGQIVGQFIDNGRLHGYMLVQ